jgi:glucose-1-phosphate adenylyltransferase
MAPHPHVFAMVLAGGEGKRLAPLTADRAKPAVPFGGDYRLVDPHRIARGSGQVRRQALATDRPAPSLRLGPTGQGATTGYSSRLSETPPPPERGG